MSSSSDDPDLTNRMDLLLAAGAEGELRLLRTERKAEKHLAAAVAALASDEARLLRARERLQRSQESVDAAEAALREVQRQRAAGPLASQS